MRYRIQVTVGMGQLAAVIEVACKNNPEPELKVDTIPEHPMIDLTPAPKVPRKGIIPKARTRRSPSSVSERGQVIETQLKTGPKRWKDLRLALEHASLSPWTLNSLISTWQKDGKIRRTPDGLWSLVEHDRERAAGAV